jgi:asparagine N-glycosylation enzyme membrane subunit Stt3
VAETENTAGRKDYFEMIKEHIEEPLFAVSMIAFLCSMIGSLAGVTYFQIIAMFLGLLGALSIYFIYLYFKADKKNYGQLLLPVFIFAAAAAFWYASTQSGFALRDMVVLAMMIATFLLFATLYVHKLLGLSVAAICAIFFCTLIIHVAPADTIAGVSWTGKYISNIDPYFWFRHSDTIVTTGIIPEKETLSYPTDPPSFLGYRMGVAVFMGSVGTLIQPLGFSAFDVAMLYAGVFAAFCVLIIYLLMIELFAEMYPYNHVAGLLAAFMLMLNPAFAISAIATNCEDDTLGMFLLLSSFLLFTLSYRRRSYLLAVLSGLSLLALGLTWDGYNYAIAVLGIFAFIYSFASLLRNRNCMEHIPYFVIAGYLSLVTPLWMHARGAMPVFSMPATLILVSLASPVLIAFVLEAIRSYRSGKIKLGGVKIEDAVEGFLENNIVPITVLLLVAAVVFSVTVINPSTVITFILNNIRWAKQQDIIGMTTAEQVELCSGFDVFSVGTYGSCMSTLTDSFGLTAFFAIIMIPFLLYLAAKERTMGPVFILTWGLPMLWGVVNKSQYMFTTSAPLVALAATVGLLVAVNRKDLESLKVLPTILLIAAPIFLYFMQGGIPVIEPFGGLSAMYHGVPGEIAYWDPALQWLKAQPNNTVVLTWWDYGHWITAISHKTSIADNTKSRQGIVQDLARFHVLETNETKALAIAQKYNATMVIIDYTMIGKSSAPHFIATSNLTASYDNAAREGEHMGYGQCAFSATNSRVDAEYVSDGAGGFNKKRTLVYVCNIGGNYSEYIGALVFEIIDDSQISVKVNPITLRSGQLTLGKMISWESWRQEHKASILGVQSPFAILGNAIASKENPTNYISFPTYTSFVYVPEKFNKYMMTSLYLGDYMNEYKTLGLCDPSVQKLKHFKLIDAFNSSAENFLGDGDISYLGYIRAYSINYSAG